MFLRRADRASRGRLPLTLRARGAAFAVAVAAVFFGGPAAADLLIPANAVVSLNSGQFDLACTDLVVAGTLRMDTGSVINIRHVTIQGGGVIDGGAGTIRLGGNWTNGGQFMAGTSRVEFRDLCSQATAIIVGGTSFANLSLVSALGKNYIFNSGETQIVAGILEIAGSAAQPIQIRASTAGTPGYLNLLPSGTQQIQHVGVTDNWATGQWLAPNQVNEGGAGNARRWFGTPTDAEPIPATRGGTLAALAALLALFGALAVRRRGTAAQMQRGRRRATRTPAKD